MATLRLRNGVYFVDFRADGVRYRISTRTGDKKIAHAVLEDYEAKVARAKYLRVSFKRLEEEEKAKTKAKVGTLLVDFFRRFRAHMDQYYSKGTIQPDTARLNMLQDFFARKKIRHLRDITPDIVDDFTTTVLAGRKPKTIKNYLLLLKTALNYAVEWGLIQSNPIKSVKMPKVVKTFHYYSKREVSRLLKEADEPLRTGIIILVNTGLRRGELFHLRWQDVDLKQKTLRVWPYDEFTPKGKRPRSIPLNDQVRKVLARLFTEADLDCEFVFRPYESIHTLGKEFLKLVRSLKMKGNLHSLRHTFASHLAMAGVPIPVIKELLGHSDISTTMIYAHLSPHTHKSAVKKLKF